MIMWAGDPWYRINWWAPGIDVVLQVGGSENSGVEGKGDGVGLSSGID